MSSDELFVIDVETICLKLVRNTIFGRYKSMNVVKDGFITIFEFIQLTFVGSPMGNTSAELSLLVYKRAGAHI